MCKRKVRRAPINPLLFRHIVTLHRIYCTGFVSKATGLPFSPNIVPKNVANVLEADCNITVCPVIKAS